VLSGMKAGFKSILNYEHPLERKKMFNLKRSSKLSATLLALSLGAIVFLGSLAVADENLGEPIYGGKLTYLTLAGQQFPPKSWDITTGYWHATEWSLPFQSWLIVGDVEKYGPRGSNVFQFQSGEDVPALYHKGDLAESFEYNIDGAIFRLHKGMMWSGNEKIGMKPREITANDVVTTLKRAFATEIGKSLYEYVKDVRATDKYTVEVDWTYNVTWPFWWDGPFTGIYAPETLEAGIDPWENQVSSGPFVMTDLIENTAVFYKKNPLYKREKTTINGKEYGIPFIDELVYPYIPDESTQIAALRTAKIDGIQRTPVKYKDELPKELKMWKYPSGGAPFVNLQTCNSTCSGYTEGGGQKWLNKNVRRAIAIGSDRDAIGTALYGEGNYILHGFASYGGPTYTYQKDLPPETQKLFKYDPELAKKMLAEAGYPKGFDMEMVFDPSNTNYGDLAAILVDQWSKIGVNVKLIPMESAAHLEVRMNRKFRDAYLDGDSMSMADISDMQSGQPQNSTSFHDEYYDKEFARAQTIMHAGHQAEIIRNIVVRYTDNSHRIQLPEEFLGASMWPWAKNYYGEVEMGFWNAIPAITRLWIDEDMKSKMGF